MDMSVLPAGNPMVPPSKRVWGVTCGSREHVITFTASRITVPDIRGPSCVLVIVMDDDGVYVGAV